MIPRRLYLKNFMSYKAPQEILFNGVQALSGDNGSGKSATFDAITYALFDEHRLGKQHADKLIHKGEDQLNIEFDFTIGEDEYRIKRSHTQKGVATRQILHLAGPNVPEPGRKSPQAIRETDSDEGFKNWVERVVGLNYNAFTSSALLLQGNSDALLKAKSADRHAMLTQIIDLDPYIRLSNRATDKYRESESLKKDAERRLRNFVPIDEQRILNLAQEVELGKVEAKQHRDRLLELTRLKVDAGHWWTFQTDLQEYQGKLQHLQALAEQEELLIQQSARYRELDSVLSPLQTILQQQDRCTEAQQQLANLTTQQDEVALQKLDTEDMLHLIQEELGLNRVKQQELVQQQLDYGNRQLELTPQVNDIKRLLEKRQDCIKLEESIVSYSADLDAQLADAQQRQRHMQAMHHILTPLNQFYTARSMWQQDGKTLEQVTVQLSSLSRRIAESEQREREQVILFQEWQQKESAAKESVAHGRALLIEPQQRLDNLDEVDGTAQCRYCGHSLTPEHLQAERERLTAHIKSLTEELNNFQQTYTFSCEEKGHAEDALKEAQLTRSHLRDEYTEVSQQQTVLTTKRQGQEGIAQDAFNQLSSDYVYKITLTDPSVTSISTIFTQSSYPTEQDIQDLRVQLAQEQSVQQTIEGLQTDIGQRNRLVDRRADIESEVRDLEALYSPDLILNLPLECEKTKLLLKDIQNQSLAINSLITSKEQEEKEQRDAYQEISRQEREKDTQIAFEKSRIESAQYILNEHLQKLPVPWQKLVEAVITIENLASWEDERKQLVGSEESLQQLNEERSRKKLYEQNIKHLDEKLAAVSPEAQRPIEEFEQDIEQIEQLSLEAEKRVGKLHDEHMDLERLKSSRLEAENEYKDRVRESHLYKSLHLLLGPNSLQRHLLQRAEQAIVAYANETLERISGGALRLELTTHATKSTGALDLVVYNYAVNPTQPLEVGLLSGSQQFRVAVSLALGIGKYTGGESRRVESVIIDEGFGSLDTAGRQDMLHVLQALKNELASVIVVSHQNEFFDEFENKYHMELVDGSTQVSII